jgi:hypothetical protein
MRAPRRPEDAAGRRAEGKTETRCVQAQREMRVYNKSEGRGRNRKRTQKDGSTDVYPGHGSALSKGMLDAEAAIEALM